ncbi:LEA_2 domain-containing protein [Psidium guajava]|nr:LEA_2 domain-containing protein [Psidium guajava]
MAEKEQARPLAPALYIARSDAPATVRNASYIVRSDEDEALSSHFRLRQPSCLKCCGITGALFLILAVVALALVFTVFHVKDPIVSMKRIQIPQLAQLVSNGTAPSGANITAVVDVSVKNPNAASFRYGNSTTELYYGGEVVGEGRIPAGKAAARRTQSVNVTVEVVPARIAKAARLSSDLAAGNLTMESSTRIDGRVKILKIIRKHVVVTLNCTITYVIASQEIEEKCRRRVSF